MYTAKQIWKAALTETNKSGAPSLLLSDYNYFINKAINLYINKHYTIYDINQQTTDDLRVLKSSALLVAKNVNYQPEYNNSVINLTSLGAGLSKLYAGIYEVVLPRDYLHMLNCRCIFKLYDNWECYDKGNDISFKATKLSSDNLLNVDDDYYLNPKPWRPYYYIHNVNISNNLSTNTISDDNPYGTDFNEPFETDYSNLTHKPTEQSDSTAKTSVSIQKESPDTYETEDTKLNGFKRTITLNKKEINVVDVKPGGIRLSNPSGIRCEIRCGRDDSVFLLKYVQIDYIKAPQQIRLTQEQIDLTKDTSLIMEFPDYVCQEIINELVMLIMENQSNQRLQTHPQVSLSINYQNAAPLQAPQQTSR